HVANRGSVVHDLIEGEEAEIHRHDFHDRSHATQCGSDAGTNEGAFRQRCVSDALRPELVQQPLATSIGSTILADVFAHEKHAWVILQRLMESGSNGFSVCHFNHVSPFTLRLRLRFRTDESSFTRS